MTTIPTSQHSPEEVWDERSLRVNRRRRRVAMNLGRVGLAVAVLLVWELASRFVIDPMWISSPATISEIFVDWFVTSGSIYPHLGATSLAMILGLLVGTAAGIVVAVIVGFNDFLADVISPFFAGLYSLPRVALAPIFVLWFGIGLAPKVVLTAVVVFFLTFLSTLEGIKSVDRELSDLIRIMNATRSQLLLKVTLPSALPWILNGLRAAIPYSLIGAVVGEFVAATEGIGWLVANSAALNDTGSVYAAILVLAAMGFGLAIVVDLSDRKLTRWRATDID